MEKEKGYVIMMSIVGGSVLLLSMYMMVVTFLNKSLGMFYFIPSLLLNIIGIVFGLMLLVPVMGVLNEWKGD